MYVCISITELMVFIFIDSISLPCFSKLPGGHFIFLLCDFFVSFALPGLAHGTSSVFMLQGLQPVGLLVSSPPHSVPFLSTLASFRPTFGAAR